MMLSEYLNRHSKPILNTIAMIILGVWALIYIEISQLMNIEKINIKISKYSAKE